MLVQFSTNRRSAPVVFQRNDQTSRRIRDRFSNNRFMKNGHFESILLRLGQYAYRVFKWHIKSCPNNRTLVVFRIISILTYLALLIIDTVAYAVPSNPPTAALQFIWGAKYPLYDIATIIYCSGAPVLGVSFEIYPFVSLAIVNVILQVTNCSSRQLSIVFLVRIICLVVAVELAYWNFRRLCAHLQPRAKSSRVMLRQSLLFSLSIIFFASAGLRTVFDGALNKCEFQHYACGLIDMDAPVFRPHASCDPSFVEYVSSREELRILRDWLVLNIACYAIFNRALLDFRISRKSRIWGILARSLLLILFLAITTSFLVVNISPFQLHDIKIVFDVIECALFISCLVLMIYNLIHTRHEITLEEDFEEDPHILPKV